MAGLTGQFLAVPVDHGRHRHRGKPLERFNILHGLRTVRAVAMAGLATHRIAVQRHAAKKRPLSFDGHLIAAAVHLVARGQMTGGAGEIETQHIHMDIEAAVSDFQRGVQVAVFGGVAMATIEMAGTAGITAGFADTLSDFLQIDGT